RRAARGVRAVKHLCIIGDSHTAAIKRAWWAIENEYPDIKITFFSSHRRRFVNLAVEGGMLVPKDEEHRGIVMRSCKLERVITGAYALYVLCGMDYSLYYAMTLLMPYRTEDQASDNRTPISSGCYLKAMTGCLRDTVAVYVARKLRRITARPM